MVSDNSTAVEKNKQKLSQAASRRPMTKGKARKQALLQSSSSSSSIRVFARMLLAAACCAVVFWSKLPAAAAVVTMQPVARINAGGAQYVDAQGNTWQDDAVVFYQNGGTMGEKRVVAGAVIQNTTNPTLYQSEHWWRRTKPGPFLYEIPVPVAGAYTVELHFAELVPTRARVGKCIFDVWVQGALVFAKFDVFKQAGAAFTAVNITTVTTVATNGGILAIEFRPVRSNPKISAIAVYWNGVDVIHTGAPSSFPSQKPSSVPSTLPSVAPSEHPNALPTSETYFQPVLINTGGNPYMDVEGNWWQGDLETKFFTGGLTESFPVSISGTQDDPLYQSERYGIFTYEIPLPPGDYEVILHFAELIATNTNPGDRVFDIAVEQSPTFQGVDIVRLVGANKAVTLETAAAVLDGSLSLSFSAVTGNPCLAAIEINLVGDHLAHAVANGPYAAVDILGGGFALVTVDGSLSHTHGQGLNLTSWIWSEGFFIKGTGEVATLNLTVGDHYITLRVTDDGDNKSSETTTVTVLPKGFPVIDSLTPTSGFVDGGHPVTIHGYGFNFTADAIVVQFGNKILTGDSQISVVDANTILVLSIPASSFAVPVSVTVTTPISKSNAGIYAYVKGAPIDWTRGYLYDIYAPTTLAFGPDSKLYIGTSDGKLVKLTLSENNVVVEAVVSTIVLGRAILGMTFDPMSAGISNPPVYVSHSKTFHGESKSSSGQAINGKVSIISGANLDAIQDIITGLPVSDHDHAVNGLEFGDSGELYIMIGGNTNGGIPGALSGSQLQKENVLSAAALVARLSDPEFNGFLTYDALDDGNLNSGFGVEVFASGLRNPFDVVLHSNKKLYATDNGPNLKYGDMSSSCAQGVPDVEEEDKLNLLVQGGYYGHANRKRGQTDPRQCIWRSSLEPSDGGYTAPIAILKSSSDGIIEFQSDHFGKQLRGDLIIAKYKGGLYRVILSDDGTAVRPESNPPTLLDVDGDLAVVQGPDGTLYVAKYKVGKIRYLVPLEPASTTLVVKSVFPRRGGQAGGTVFSIFGERFDSSGTPVVSVGGSACPVLAFDASKITCILPGGSGTVDITVTTSAEAATFLAGYRYISGLPTSVPVALINAGGAAYTDTQGNVWEADAKHAYYSLTNGARGATMAAISGTDDDKLYQSYRVFNRLKPAPYQYVIPVPAPGKYMVTLHFCETDPSRATAGMRVMDIWVEGKLVSQKFDIAVAAGGAFTATTLTVTSIVVDGSLTLELKAVTYNPTISAIAVYGIGP